MARGVARRTRLPVVVPAAGYDCASVFGSALLIVADFEFGGGSHAPSEVITDKGKEKGGEMDRRFGCEFPVVAPAATAVASGKGLVRAADSRGEQLRAFEQVAVSIIDGRGEAQIAAGVRPFQLHAEALAGGCGGEDGRVDPHRVRSLRFVVSQTDLPEGAKPCQRRVSPLRVALAKQTARQ